MPQENKPVTTKTAGWKLVPWPIPQPVIAVLKDYAAHPENYPIYNQLWYEMLAACPEYKP